jgi:hypothetical protein
MSKASNAAKQKWNAENYTQIKVSVNPDVANAFKNACAQNGVSMASVLGVFMSDYANNTGNPASEEAGDKFHSAQTQIKSGDDPRKMTLRKRRKAMTSVCLEIADLIDSENECIENTPINLRNSERYVAAEERLALLEEASELIGGIYAQ